MRNSVSNQDLVLKKCVWTKSELGVVPQIYEGPRDTVCSVTRSPWVGGRHAHIGSMELGSPRKVVEAKACDALC